MAAPIWRQACDRLKAVRDAMVNLFLIFVLRLIVSITTSVCSIYLTVSALLLDMHFVTTWLRHFLWHKYLQSSHCMPIPLSRNSRQKAQMARV